MMTENHEIFVFDKQTVFFKHTDYHGYLHGYNYLEWMSYARESFFQELVPDFLDLCSRNIKMVTARVEFESLSDAVFGDKIVVKIFSEKVKRSSFDVVFSFFRKSDNNVLGNGRMTLAFLDAETGRLTCIPEGLKRAVVRFERKNTSRRIEIDSGSEAC